MARETVIAYLGLGTNLGDRASNLAAGLRLLLGFSPDPPGRSPSSNPGRSPGSAPALPPPQGELRLKAVSSIYETAPWGLTDQPAFLNAVCAVETTLSAPELLSRCLAVEQALGRVRLQRWGPRSLDLDLLLFGNAQISQPDLIVPHPRLTERAFVLVPLLEIAPDLTLPDGWALSRFLPGVADQAIALWQPGAAFLRELQAGNGPGAAGRPARGE